MRGSVARPVAADILEVVAARMRRQGIAGLPRNYEIVYEAVSASDDWLERELQALGASPSQDALDELGRRHLGRNDHTDIVDTAYRGLAAKVEEIMALLGREQRALDKYGVVLSQTSEGLSKHHAVSRELLNRIADILTTATSSKIEQGRQIASTIADKSCELEEVKAKLEDYKHLAETDALTQIANRRAFDRRLAEIFEDPKAVLFHGLIMLDVDLFKTINDGHGHYAGDRVLQALAGVMKSNIRDDMFLARTGGEEFAVIVDGLSQESTVKLAEDLRKVIEQTAFLEHKDDPAGRITVSVGVCMAAEAQSPEDLYVKADQALYASKKNGRNRVSTYPLPAAPHQRRNWYLYRTD